MRASAGKRPNVGDCVRRLCAGAMVIALAIGILACRNSGGPELGFRLLTQRLPKGPLSNEQLAGLSVEETPFLSLDDILSYDKSSHEMTLTDDAAERLRALDVPVSGRPFVIRVAGKPIYAAAFWTPISSMGFDGVIIMQPLHPDQQTVRLELGYPSATFYAGQDPRGDPRIMDALDRAGKLR